MTNYPKIHKQSSAYVNGAIYTYINSFLDLEGKNMIKLSLGDRYSAILLLQKYCACLTNADILTSKEMCNKTKIFPTLSAMHFI